MLATMDCIKIHHLTLKEIQQDVFHDQKVENHICYNWKRAVCIIANVYKSKNIIKITFIFSSNSITKRKIHTNKLNLQ